MTKKSDIKIFEDKKVRSVWDDETEEWYFAVVDVVEVLTESTNPTDYTKKLKKRDPELAKGWGQIVTPLSVPTAGGKQRVNCAKMEGVFRLIQSIPSPKAEPFKMWMAQVAAERLDEIADPEKAILRGADYYRAKGYTEGWINQRLQAIEMRKPDTFGQSVQIAKEGGSVAGDARKNIESRIGTSVISPLNASDKGALEIENSGIIPTTEH